MSKKNYVIAGSLAAVVLGCALYVFQGDAPKPAAAAAPSSSTNAAASTVKGDQPKLVGQFTKDTWDFEWNVKDAKAYSSNPPREDWEEEILTIAREPGEEMEKVDKLLKRFPTLNEDGQLLALEHIVTLLPDHAYTSYRSRLQSMARNDDMREALLVDVLTRDDTIRFTALVEMLRLSDSKAKEEAREILEAYLDKDYGSDPTAWEVAVKAHLAEENAEG